MTRYEMGTPQDRAALKAEIKADLRRDTVRHRLAAFGSCATILLMALAIPTFLAASVIAKTGLIEVPVFSKKQISFVQPVRNVMPLVGSQPEDVIASVMAAARYDQATDRITISFTEQQLTTLVGPMLNGRTIGKGEDAAVFTGGQIAVNADSMELHATFSKKGKPSAAALAFKPAIERGAFAIDTLKFVVGSVEVPRVVADMLLSTLVMPMKDGIKGALGGDAESIREFRLEPGEIFITIDKP